MVDIQMFFVKNRFFLNFSSEKATSTKLNNINSTQLSHFSFRGRHQKDKSPNLFSAKRCLLPV